MDKQTDSILVILKRVYYLSCTVGLSLFSCKTFHFKASTLLYNLLLSIPIGYNIGLLIYWVRNPSDLPKTAIFFLTMNDTFVYSLAVLSWVVVVVKHDTVVLAVKTTLAIGSDITKAGITLSLRKLTKVQVWFSVIFIVLLLLKYYLDQVVESGDSHWYGFYLADAINNVVIVQFTTLLWLLKEYYECVNDKLESYMVEHLEIESYQLD